MIEPNAPGRPLKLREHDVPDEDAVFEGLEYSIPLPEHQGSLRQLLISSLSDAVVNLGEQVHQCCIAANHVINVFVRNETGFRLGHSPRLGVSQLLVEQQVEVRFVDLGSNLFFGEI